MAERRWQGPVRVARPGRELVEWYEVQMRAPGWSPMLAGTLPEWLDVAQTRRADEGEAHDLAELLRRDHPAGVYRVIRRTGPR